MIASFATYIPRPVSDRPEIVLAPVDAARDWPFLGRAHMNAMDDDPISLRINPVHLRRSMEERVDAYIYAKQREAHFLALRPNPPRETTHMIKATIAETGAVVGMAIWVAPLDRTETLGDLTEDEKKDEEFVKKAKEKGKEEREKAIETMIDGAFREAFLGEMKRRHKEVFKGQPYWYLRLLFVDPAYQSLGIGQKLLAWGTSQADAASLPSYVEATIPGKRVYERKGFEVIGWSELPGSTRKEDKGTIAEGPLRWPYMLRQPQPLKGQEGQQTEVKA